MAAPIYFFPRLRLEQLVAAGHLSQEILERYRLDGVLGDVSEVAPHCRADLPKTGPGDASGCLFATNTKGQPPLRFGYYPDFQDWQVVCNDPELWIGIDREHRPKPCDLVRSQIVPGHPVTLADGNQYEVPVIRSLGRRTNLPEDMYWDAAGDFQVELKQQYRSLWDATEPVWNLFYGQKEPGASVDVLFTDALKWCLTFLGVNYRYGRQEHMVLRLVDRTEPIWGGILRAVVDGPWVEACDTAQKKTESQ